ncbi:MAG TPA: DUF1614 domain-containing protein [Candidatus Binataceae bacterium]|nr:DUF1614 domain-containing protein [Candidatus Binataceae bacterium]
MATAGAWDRYRYPDVHSTYRNGVDTIGGAGTFDGVFLTGIVAGLLT